MRRITRIGLAAFLGAAVLTLSLSAVARGQLRAQPTEPDPASLTDVQKASLTRMKEVLEVVNTGNHATIVAYFKANAVKTTYPGPPGAEPITHEQMAIQVGVLRAWRSGGLDLLRVIIDPSSGAVGGIVRNRMTGDEETIRVQVESQAPHHIIALGGFAAAVTAPFGGLKRAESVAVTEEERLQEIGAYLKRMGDADIFSGAVVIARDGTPVFAQAYGYADREKKIPNTVDTPILLASLTKPFTGLAIGQLVEQGKLNYDDPLSKFLPDFPDAESAKKIKVKHLLSHTSGLAQGSSPSDKADDRVTTVKAMVDGFERKAPAFEPGTKSSYSNMGFVLLGRILEIVTGQDYYEYMQTHVFAPAGVTSASFPLLPGNGVAVVPMAYPYEGEFDFKSLRSRYLNQLGKDKRRGSPAGSAIASALDLIKLASATHAGRIVKLETLRLHSSPKPELGAPNYGYGFMTGPRYGRPFVGHNGNAAGQCTNFGELRDTPYTIVVLSNVTIFTCMEVTERILRVLRPS
jgi:D-alanyl-D-alanine carboxypeptidase